MKILITSILALTLTCCAFAPPSSEEDPTACAVVVAKTITDPDKDYLILGIAKQIESAKSNEVEKIIEHVISLAKQSGTHSDKIHTLSKCAIAYGKIGIKNKALSILSEAVNGVDKNNSPLPLINDLPMLSIVRAYISLEEPELALKVLNKTETKNIYSRIQIAEIFTKKQKNKSLKMLSEAITTVKEKKSGYNRARTLTFIVFSYLKIGEVDKALALAREMSDAEDYPNEHEEAFSSIRYKAVVLTAVAKKYFESGKYEKGMAVLSEAEKVADKTKHWFLKANMMKDIALTYTGMGKYSTNGFFFIKGDFNRPLSSEINKGVNTAKYIKNPLLKAYTLYWIAMQYLNNGKKDEASRMFSEIFQILEKIDNQSEHAFLSEMFFKSYSKPDLLTKLAVAFAQTGDVEKGLKISRSIDSAYENGFRRSKVNSLVEIAAILWKEGNNKQADKLLSEAIKVAKKINPPHPHSGLSHLKAEDLRKISCFYANNGLYDKAIDIALTNDFKGAETLKQIVMIASDKGKYEKALEIAAKIGKPCYKAEVLAVIGNHYPKPGEKISERSRDILRQIIKQTEAKKKEKPNQKDLLNPPSSGK